MKWKIFGLLAGLATICTIIVVAVVPDLVNVKIASGYNSLFGDTTSAPPPPTAPIDEHVLHRHFKGVDASKNGEETYEIKGVIAPPDPEGHWGDIIEVLSDGGQQIVDLNPCIEQVGVDTNWRTLKPQFTSGWNDKINCGTNVQARCLVLQDGDCQPR